MKTLLYILGALTVWGLAYWWLYETRPADAFNALPILGAGVVAIPVSIILARRGGDDDE